MKKNLYTLFVFAMLLSCNNAEQKNTSLSINDSTSFVEDTIAMHTEDLFKDVVFDSKKDFVCGMPTSAGVSDTLHYKDKIYGFCSKECKDEFVKNPAAYLVAK